MASVRLNSPQQRETRKNCTATPFDFDWRQPPGSVVSAIAIAPPGASLRSLSFSLSFPGGEVARQAIGDR